MLHQPTIWNLTGMNFMNKKLYLLTLCLISSCSAIQDNSGYYELFGAVNKFIFPEDTIMTSDFIEDFPVSFAMVRIGRSSEIRMVLLSAENNIYEWISSDRIKIYTKSGKIIKTIGLTHDIEYQDIPDHLDILSDQIFRVNFFYPKLYDITAISKFTNDEYQLLESMIHHKIGWNVINKYHLKNGEVVESIQQIHPHFPTIQMKFFIK